MMKRLLSIFTASALAVSAAAALQLSAAAFTLSSTYDEVKINNSFNTESNTGAPDGTAYKISDGTDTIWAPASINIDSNFYLSLDFKFAKNDGTNQIAMVASNNFGPVFSAVNENFRVKSGGGSSNKDYTTLYNNFDSNKWYKIELEGRMRVTGAVTAFTLYEYNNGVATQVAHDDSMGLGWFYAGATRTYVKTSVAEGVCYDNEYAVQEWPDGISITEENGLSEVYGGDSLMFTAAAIRNNVSDNITQPTISLSLSGVKSGEEGYIKLEDGKLTVSARASAQNINVIAAATSNGKELSAQYPVSIKARDLSDEKFDSITVTGDPSINAGSTGTYSFTATKNGSDVTSGLAANDVAWSIYDSTGSRILGNKAITVSNGTVTVDESVIGQNIRVRASSPSGYIYGDASVTINTVSEETVINSNACEEELDGAVVTSGSWDGSSYYVPGTSTDFLGAGTMGTGYSAGDILIMADVKFGASGAGINEVRRDGTVGVVLTSNGSYLVDNYTQTSYAISADKWYHIELMFNSSNSSVNIWEYDGNGNLTNKGTFTNLGMRNDNAPFNRIRLYNNTGIDNLLVVYPHADTINVVTDGEVLSTGASMNAGITGSRNGLAMPALSSSSVNWAIYDSSNQYPIATDDVTVTAGVVTASAMAAPQTVYVRATSVYDNTVFGFALIRITAGKQFEITNIGVDSVNENEVVMIYANKLTDYKDDVVFLMTFFDENGRLVGAYSKKANAKNLSVGENEIVIDYTLPEGYNKETGTAKLMAWTSLTSNEEPEGISGSFRASYTDGVITLSNAPSVSGTTTIAIFDSGNNVVYQTQSDSAVASLNTGALASGGYTVTLGGAVVDGSYVTYKATFTVD